MGVLAYTSKKIIRDFSKYKYYCLAIILSCIITVLSVGIIYNKEIVSDTDFLIASFAGLKIFVLVNIFMIFTSIYYVNSDSKEAAIILFTGKSIFGLSRMYVLRNIIILGVFSVIGIIFGLGINYALTKYIFHAQLGYNEALRSILQVIPIYTLIMMIIISMFNIGSVQDKSILDMINENDSGYRKDTRSRIFKKPFEKSFRKKVYITLYLIPIITLLIGLLIFRDWNLVSGITIIFMNSNLIAIPLITKKYIPMMIMELKEKKYSYDKEDLVVSANINYSSRKLGNYVAVMAIAILYLIVQIAFWDKDITNIPYIINIGLLSMAVIVVGIITMYKFIKEVEIRKGSYRQLKLLGYTNKIISSIIKKECLILGGIIFLMPLGAWISVIVPLLMSSLLSIKLVIIIMGLLVIGFVVMTGVMYVNYGRIIKKYLNTVEKYN